MQNIPKKLIEKYNISVPRYTSYPPANFFEDINSEKYLEAVENSNKNEEKNISIYIHIPFCKNLCFYCGCNMMLMRSNLLIEEYFKALEKEIKIILKKIDKTRKLSQIHYGWWTPNAVDIKYLQKINKIFLDNFETIEKPEIAIEAHPAHLDEKYIEWIVDSWFTRMSLWIQDFDLDVLKNVNRLPPKLEIEELFKIIREKKSDMSINLDFIYGLPGQTVKGFEKTIKKAIKLKPNRLVTFSYAHVPSIKPHQKGLEKIWLPSSEEKTKMYENSRKILVDAWYKTIWLDHYVLENDELNIALSTKKLARNFQWYCTKQTTGQVYAFGVSGISQLEEWFFQNTKILEDYIKNLKKSELCIQKWIIFKKEQKIIWKAIENLMCNYYLDLDEIKNYFGIELEKLKNILDFRKENFSELIKDDLIILENNILKVTEKWKFFIRNIASKIDPEFKKSKKIFSKSV